MNFSEYYTPEELVNFMPENLRLLYLGNSRKNIIGDDYTFRTFIDASFNWSGTRQGHEFWETISNLKTFENWEDKVPQTGRQLLDSMPETLRQMFFDELVNKNSHVFGDVAERYRALDIGEPFEVRTNLYDYIAGAFPFSNSIHGEKFWRAVLNADKNGELDLVIAEYSTPVILHNGETAQRKDVVELNRYIYTPQTYAKREDAVYTASDWILKADVVTYYNDDNNRRTAHRAKIENNSEYINCGEYYAHYSVAFRHGRGKHFKTGAYIEITKMTHGRAGNPLYFASFEELEEAGYIFINAYYRDYMVYYPSNNSGTYICAVSGKAYHDDYTSYSSYAYYDTAGVYRQIRISMETQISPVFSIGGQIFNPIRLDTELSINANFFSRQSAENAGIIITHCPHCNRDQSQYHNREYCKRENFRNEKYSYHSKKPRYISSRSEFKIGVEIEKESFAGASHTCHDIYRFKGWVKESDGSLDSRVGYELVSPAFGLFGNNLLKEAEQLEAKFPELINGEASSACGGHIHFSRANTSGADTLEMYCGYLPLLYAIYKGRTKQTYCRGIEKEEMKYSREKYQAVRVLDSRIEFRIFPAVKNIKTLAWRINLLRYMAKNPTASPVKVVNDLCDKRTGLHRLFLEIFSEQTIYKRAQDTLTMAQKYDRNYYNIDFTAQRKAIEKKAVKAEKK